ncbi:MAG: asparagine synthase AsnB [Pseudomonadota bacterium]|jgi:asparagine synthase (glutamine-hydrolysing)
MCGLAGIFDLRATRPIPIASLLRMNESLLHRGPDDGGIFTLPGVGLAHRRLAIIDRAGGAQPMRTKDGEQVVVFNGEIYNHHDLARQLRAYGHCIESKSDTEVILHAWRQWGPQCVVHFRGMFAFALWDAPRQSLFLARDRLGVKPLFYAPLPDGQVIFASELKALLAHGAMPVAMDELAVEEYFALGYIPDPRTIFRAARKLPPAHTLLLARGQKLTQPSRYWDVHFEPDRSLDEDTARVELARRLGEAVSIRLESEVPLGAFLSGGVDSSAVVATMSAVSGTAPTTCSIGFAERGFDETEYANLVAQKFATCHVSERVNCEAVSLIDTLAHIFDEPFADSSALPTYRVCELARRHVTVALSGDGADEVFGGYRRYRFHLAEERWRRLWSAAWRARVFGALARWYPKADRLPRYLRAKTTFQALSRDTVAAYFDSVSILRGEARRQLFSQKLKDELAGYSALEVFRHHAHHLQAEDALALPQYLDLKTYLPGDINTKVDRASMAHSLEVREPMMDHLLLEWAARLPMSMRVREGEGKWLLKKTMEPALPDKVLYRPKMGFAIPLAGWLRGPLREDMKAALKSDRLLDTGWFSPEALAMLCDEHLSGVRDHSAPIWSLLMFEAFLRKVVDGAHERNRDAA